MSLPLHWNALGLSAAAVASRLGFPVVLRSSNFHHMLVDQNGLTDHSTEGVAAWSELVLVEVLKPLQGDTYSMQLLVKL